MLYEKQVKGKNKELGRNIYPTLYKAYVEDTDLQIVAAAEWVPVQPIQEVIEEHLIACVKRNFLRTEDGENLFLIDADVSRAAMNMRIPEAEDRICSLHGDYIAE